MFLAICQGLGLAIAAGLILGVVLPPIMPTWGAVVGAAPIGVLVAGAALNGADEALWPALPVGVIGAGLAAVVARDVAAGAARRQRDQSIGGQASAGVVAIVVLAAIVIAGISLVLKPFSLLALAALLWLWASRRRQAERKHEGLRVLR
ncbi:MAG TPA: hypothetical protein VH329_02465 [Solirubrobacterales bacterium]|jgi:hypothetical protein